MSALLTYRSRDSFESRFGRRTQDKKDSKIFNEDEGSVIYSAQSYLRYQGEKFVSRFDANCYIAITRKLDSHGMNFVNLKTYFGIQIYLEEEVITMMF